MPASLSHIHPDTPMGANLIAGGATLRSEFADAGRAGALAWVHPGGERSPALHVLRGRQGE